MPASKLAGRFLCDLFCGAMPLFIPTVVIAGLDAAGSNQNFAKFACAVGRCTKGTPGFIPKLGIVWEQWGLAF